MAKIAALAAHPDDAELGMGASLALFASQGHEVYLVDLTNGEPTPKGDPETRGRESLAAARLLNVSERTTLDLPNRYLQETLGARKTVANELRRIRPDAMFVPLWKDAHPDHIAASKIGQAARFYAKFTKSDMEGEPFYPLHLYYFVASHLRLHEKPSFVLDVSDTYEQKMKAIAEYKSQFSENEANRIIFEKIRQLGQYYGGLIGADYGEPFFSMEEVGLKSLDPLLAK